MDLPARDIITLGGVAVNILVVLFGLAVGLGSLRAKIEALHNQMGRDMEGVHDRLDRVNGRLDSHGSRLDKQGQRIAHIEGMQGHGRE